MQPHMRGGLWRGGPYKRGTIVVKNDKKRRKCRFMKCTTVLHGGVCHRTSIPHKRWNKNEEEEDEKEARTSFTLMTA